MSSQQPTATWRVMQLELGLHESEARLKDLAAQELGLEPSALRGLRVARKALDARVRQGTRRMQWIYHVDVVLDAKRRSRRMEQALRSGRVREAPRDGDVVLRVVDASLRQAAVDPVVVVGAGPGGLFAAWALARNGVRAVVLDRGPAVEDRGRHVVRFHRTRSVDSERNLLFGEGGAGTYSDGKIYTRVDDPLEVPILEELVACGAPPAIVFDSLAHIGTDKLHRVLPLLRERLRAQGVEFRFETRMDELVLAGQRVRAVRTRSGEIACSAVILAPEFGRHGPAGPAPGRPEIHEERQVIGFRGLFQGAEIELRDLAVIQRMAADAAAGVGGGLVGRELVGLAAFGAGELDLRGHGAL